MLGHFAFFFGGRRNNGMGMIGTLAAIIVAPIAAMIVQMAISRTREYSADRLGAQICGRPRWLASALGKIAQIAPQIPNRTAEENPGTAHLFIFNPLGSQPGDSLFSTHPDPANRIAALNALADEMEAADRAQADEPTRDTPVQDIDADEGPWGRKSQAPAPPPKVATPKQKRPPSHRWGRQPGPGDSSGSNGPWD